MAWTAPEDDPRQIIWIVIKDQQNREIGSVGIIENQVAVICAFYDDRDVDMSGGVSWTETVSNWFDPIDREHKQLVTVAMRAALDEQVLEYDPDFVDIANSMFVTFAKGLVVDAVYQCYLSYAIGAIAKPIAGRIASGLVAEFAIRKSLEKPVKEAFEYLVRPRVGSEGLEIHERRR